MEGLLFGGAYLWRPKFAFQNWVSLIVGSKFTIFALFYFIFAGKFPSTSPWGAYIWRGDLTALGLFALLDWGGLYLEALIFRILRYIVVYIKSLNAAWATSYYFVIFFILSTPTPLRVMI